MTFADLVFTSSVLALLWWMHPALALLVVVLVIASYR